MKPDLRSLLTTPSDVDPDWPSIDVSSPPRAAARLLTVTGAPAVRLLEGNSFVGCVTAHALLRILVDDLDPLTELPRADRLRDWMAEKLTAGNEVALIFLDLDGFKEINAEQGHTAGDEVLRSVAAVLRSLTDPEIDLCARYGGDEFVIATLRKLSEAQALADEAPKALLVTATFGISGGRRLQVRQDANTGATIEELIRLASLDCMSKKSR